jgi:hypothetical protein
LALKCVDQIAKPGNDVLLPALFPVVDMLALLAIKQHNDSI